MGNAMNYITKGIGGFYYVKTPDGIKECKARGIFRKSGIKPVAGDWVELSPDGTDGYVISAWQTISTGDWNSTSGSPGIGISNED